MVAISIHQPTLSDTTIIKAGSVPFAGFISKAGSLFTLLVVLVVLVEVEEVEVVEVLGLVVDLETV